MRANIHANASIFDSEKTEDAFFEIVKFFTPAKSFLPPFYYTLPPQNWEFRFGH